MSIFSSKPRISQCSQCKNEMENANSSRCETCKKYYDGRHQAFIIYCDLVSYQAPKRQYNFWVFEGTVERTPDSFKQLLKRPFEELEETMKRFNYQKIDLEL